MTYQDILKASEGLQTMPIKGKEYVTVNERVKAFRKLFPDGTIKTNIIQINENMVVMTAEAYDGDRLLSTGTAFEVKDSSYINKTSYVENCETSAVGRALAFLGIGIDASIASSDEVENAITQQEAQKPASKMQKDVIQNICDKHGVNLDKWLSKNGVTLDMLTATQAGTMLQTLKQKYGDA